jgi:hypothetical protein
MIRSRWARLLTIATICVACLVAVARTSVAQPIQIHPPVAGPDRPIVIVVLADNFTATQQRAFDEAAANFFIHGLLTDSFYGSHAGVMTIKTDFRAVAASHTSNYGFRLGASPTTNCSITWDHYGKTTAAEVENEAGPDGATHIVVIGNYNYNFGCQHNNWVYVAVGAVGRDILHHELGHLIGGLFDEFALPANAGQVHPSAPIKRANCSSRKPAVHWSGVSGLEYLRDCALHPRVFRPYHECRMGTHGSEFCPICLREMNNEIACLRDPRQDRARCNPDLAPGPSPELIVSRRQPLALATVRTLPSVVHMSTADSQEPSAAVPILRLLVRVGSSPKEKPLTIVSANDSNGRYVPRIRRLGDYVYEVTENGVIKAVGVLPADPFEVRSYSGGVAEHSVKPTTDATFLITIPNVTRMAAVGPRPMAIAVYKLGPTVNNDPITVSRLAGFKEKKQIELVTQLSAPDVQRQLELLK